MKGIKMEDYIILKIDVKRALKTLRFKERLIIKLIYFEGYSETDAGERINIHRSRIRNIKNTALQKLKEFWE
jgi:RNA polymerase sigma factor (sigma-70 family)